MPTDDIRPDPLADPEPIANETESGYARRRELVANARAMLDARQRRLFEAVRRVIRDGIDSDGTRDELHQAFYSVRDAKDYPKPAMYVKRLAEAIHQTHKYDDPNDRLFCPACLSDAERYAAEYARLSGDAVMEERT